VKGIEPSSRFRAFELTERFITNASKHV
jgi:hypothetical protein